MKKNIQSLVFLVVSSVLVSALGAKAQVSEIRNGTVTKSKHFNGVVQIGYMTKETVDSEEFSYFPWCTGSLVSSTRVMTASHCLDFPHRTNNHDAVYVLISKDNSSPFKATYGRKFKSLKEIENLGLIVREVQFKDRIFHPKHKQSASNFSDEWVDIAFLKLGKAVKTIKPLPIASKAAVSAIKTGDKLKALGYGAYDFSDAGNPILPQDLRQVDLNFYPLGQCRKFSQGKADYRVICTREETPDDAKRKGVCGGDSGGPLMVYNSKKKRYEIAGVTSLAWVAPNGSCFTSKVSAAVKPTAFTSWVDSVAKTGYSIK